MALSLDCRQLVGVPTFGTNFSSKNYPKAEILDSFLIACDVRILPGADEKRLFSKIYLQ
jgi:hypothetical protein